MVFRYKKGPRNKAWRRQGCPLRPRWEPWCQAQQLSTETFLILPLRLRNSAGERCQTDSLHPDLPEHSTFYLSLHKLCRKGEKPPLAVYQETSRLSALEALPEWGSHEEPFDSRRRIASLISTPA